MSYPLVTRSCWSYGAAVQEVGRSRGLVGLGGGSVWRDWWVHGGFGLLWRGGGCGWHPSPAPGVFDLVLGAVAMIS